MLSAIILVDSPDGRTRDWDRARAIVKTLGALVPFVVADVVADAVIVTRPDAAIAGLEGSAGCVVVEDEAIGKGMARALLRLRRPDALILLPGFAPDLPFRAEIELALSGRETPPMAMRAEPETLLQRLLPQVAPLVALVAARARLKDVVEAKGSRLPSLVRALDARPMRSRAIRV